MKTAEAFMRDVSSLNILNVYLIDSGEVTEALYGKGLRMEIRLYRKFDRSLNY